MARQKAGKRPPLAWCDRLASWLATAEGLRSLRGLQGKLRTGRRSGSLPKNTPAGPRRIQIWEPVRAGRELAFERPAVGPFGDHYSARHSFTAHKAPSTLRVCYFGESAAAGYLYAPHLTPAQILEQQLNAIGRGCFEVIDFSRTNERIAGLMEAVEAALQIDPDVILVFAGNNWTLLETPEFSPYARSVEDRLEYAAALREGGVLGPIERAARMLLRRAGAALAQLNVLARSKGISVVLMIPEVNLADWENRQPVVWLPGDRTRSWHQSRRRAVKGLALGEWKSAEQEARQMIHWDGSTCPTSWRILARALLGQGRESQARSACRAEVDSNQYANLGFLGAPQATPMVQGMLAKAASNFGFHTVDLPAVFAEHFGDFPDRRLFLDYCHLTVPGMKVAMGAAAAKVTGILEDAARPWRDVVSDLPDPQVDSGPDAAAKLGAAVHCAHRLASLGPKGPILEYWCGKALDSSAEAAQAMLDIVRVRSTLLPETLNAAQRHNLESACKLTPQHGWRYDFIDADMTASLLNVLRAQSSELHTRALQALLDRHAVSDRARELLHPPFYLWEPLERFYPEAMAPGALPGRATLRSPWPSTSFCLVSEDKAAIELALCARLPGIDGLEERRQGRVGVRVNGQPLGSLSVGPSWGRHRFRIGPGRLRCGLNKLTLSWPAPHWPGEMALDAAVSRLERGLQADLHPVFGEVFQLQAICRSGAGKAEPERLRAS